MACFANGSAVKLYYVLEGATKTASTISAAATDSSYSDSGSGFLTAGFAVGQIITVSGFANAANNGKRKIATAAAGKLTVTNVDGSPITLVDAAASPPITIVMEGSIPGNPQFKPIRFVSEGLSPNINQIESAEINQARQRAPSRGGTYSVQGEIAAEVSFGSFDDLIEAALQGTWAGDVLIVGSTERSFAILERHTDIGADYIYRGCRVNTLNISAPLGEKAGITFGMIGTKAEPYTIPGGATFAAATTSDMMVTTNGSFTEGGQAIAYATEWNLTLDNGMEAAFSLFQREAYCVTNGIAAVSGTMNAYLKDGSLWAKVLNETETSHTVVLEEGADSYTIELPKVRYTQGQKQVGGPGAVIPQYTYSAGYDGTTTMRITRS
ncbi:phage tail tube protein [Pseudomonas nitroreducens]|uniref:phage tail tube protein n=1 Tax=Pseudomonas nitroreducens TaxID=46680 RepID=UPI00244AFBCC|nr:phage tail tube protein [Pseudomonas nitroreducens]MDG9855592.1 phage tail tube protein [Pseudomonas nitroreducens]